MVLANPTSIPTPPGDATEATSSIPTPPGTGKPNFYSDTATATLASGILASPPHRVPKAHSRVRLCVILSSRRHNATLASGIISSTPHCVPRLHASIQLCVSLSPRRRTATLVSGSIAATPHREPTACKRSVFCKLVVDCTCHTMHNYRLLTMSRCPRKRAECKQQVMQKHRAQVYARTAGMRSRPMYKRSYVRLVW